MMSRDLAQRQPVLAQRSARDLDVGDVVRHVAELDLRDAAIGQQPVAQPLGELAERPDVDVAVEPDLHDLALARRGGCTSGCSMSSGKVRIRLTAWSMSWKAFMRSVPATSSIATVPRPSRAGRRDLLDALDAAHRLLDRAQDALLDLGRRGAGVADPTSTTSSWNCGKTSFCRSPRPPPGGRGVSALPALTAWPLPLAWRPAPPRFAALRPQRRWRGSS